MKHISFPLSDYEKDFKKGMRKADELIGKAKEYLAKHGYRENLGYDSDVKLAEYLSTLTLPYRLKCQIKEYYFDLCNRL